MPAIAIFIKKQSLKIEERSEREENDDLSPKKRPLTRKSAADPIIKNSLIKKNNFAKKITATNVNKNKKIIFVFECVVSAASQNK